MKKIDIVEVGPRDGFQNLPEFLPTEKKLEIIADIVAAGVKHIQITSFVSPKAIPQMQDAGQVAAECLKKYPELDLFALVPNFRGAQGAVAAGMKKVANVISLSVSHNKANVNRSHDESFADLAKIKETYPDLEVVLDVATAFGCPFEGKYHDVAPMLAFIQRGWDLGVRTFVLCDTVGVADPAQVRIFLSAAKE
ncbi:MAG: hydroxymethylglutaryl-CoA lyase, partial [Oscillospiraceae bacterium]